MSKKDKIDRLEYELEQSKETVKILEWKIESRDIVVDRLTEQWMKSEAQSVYNDNRWDNAIDENYDMACKMRNLEGKINAIADTVNDSGISFEESEKKIKEILNEEG